MLVYLILRCTYAEKDQRDCLSILADFPRHLLIYILGSITVYPFVLAEVDEDPVIFRSPFCYR